MSKTEIIIHCAATPNGRPFTVEDIDSWHKERGFSRSNYWREKLNWDLTSIGYQYVIYVDGSIHSGRHEEEIGAHCVGHNQQSVGICMVGTDDFTPEQWESLSSLVSDIMDRRSISKVVGHRDTGAKKECPGFDVTTWMAEAGLA